LRAGYGGKGQNRKSAGEAASRLRAMPKIANAIAKLMERNQSLVIRKDAERLDVTCHSTSTSFLPSRRSY
jgi:hypothetical protein